MMLYRLAHILREHLPWFWDCIGFVNSLLFKWRYRHFIYQIPNILAAYSIEKFRIVPLNKDNTVFLENFFTKQPESAFDFFKPHKFDNKTIQNLARDNSFLAFLVLQSESIGEENMDDDSVVGYFFLRSFFFGKCYRGYMTDYQHRRMGINKMMGECATKIAILFGMPMYGTISPQNIASMKSAQTVNVIKIIKTLDNGDYFVEYLPIRNKVDEDYF